VVGHISATELTTGKTKYFVPKKKQEKVKEKSEKKTKKM